MRIHHNKLQVQLRLSDFSAEVEPTAETEVGLTRRDAFSVLLKRLLRDSDAPVDL